MRDHQPTYWFAAKRYGWGWGFPTRWQGWVTFLGYLAAVSIGIYVIQEKQSAPALVGYLATVTGIFVAVVVWKGEPPWKRSQK